MKRIFSSFLASFPTFTIFFLVLIFFPVEKVLADDTVDPDANDNVQVYDNFPFPEKLSQWKLFLKRDNQWILNKGVLPYTLNNPLFSDYAQKFRTVWMPSGTQAKYRATGPLDYPLGTIFSKTFYYPSLAEFGPVLAFKETEIPSPFFPNQNKVIETRLLVKTTKGWVGLPYVWDEEMNDAKLEITGASKDIIGRDEQGVEKKIRYKVPNFNQCKGCHIEFSGIQRLMKPIGPTAMNLNRDFPYESEGGAENQLVHWQKQGYLLEAPHPDEAPRLPVWNNPSTGTLHQRAKAYLEVNCAHCHNPSGPARNSRLFLQWGQENPLQYGVCKSPIAVGNGGGGLPYAIYPGRPEQSILVYRIQSEKPEEMMPELGRTIVHRQGVSLIAEWIKEMTGDCHR